MEKHYNNLLKKYQIQKETLKTLSEHKDNTKSEIDKINAVIRFIESFEADIKYLKNLPF